MSRKSNYFTKKNKFFKIVNNIDNVSVSINQNLEDKINKNIFSINKTQTKKTTASKKLLISCNQLNEREKFPSEKKLNYSLKIDLESKDPKPKSNEDYLQHFVNEFKPKELSGIPNWLFENFKNEKENESKIILVGSSNLNQNKENIKRTKNIRNADGVISNFEKEKNICIYCNKVLNTKYLKYEHLCPEKNLSENPNRENIENVCPFCKCSFSRSYFLKHYRKCKKEGVWCDACQKKISLEDLDKHNKQFHSKKMKKKRKGKTEWIRTRCEFCPKRIRLRNKYNHLLKCWGFRIFLTNPKIFDIKTFKKPNLYKRNWVENKWVKIPFKVCKRVNIPKGYEIGCCYDLQGNKYVDFDEQQNLILPWIPEITKPRNRKILIHDFLQRKTNRLPAGNAKEIYEKIKLQVELELLKRKLDRKYLGKNFDNNLESEQSYESETILVHDEELIDSIESIKCYEIFIRLKENIQKMQIELTNFNLLPVVIQERNLSDKLYLEKELIKMQEINKIFNDAEDFQLKLKEADNLDLETCFASDDEIDCEY